MTRHSSTPTSATEWTAQYAEGELTPAQKAALTDWLCESPRHVRELLELALLSRDLDALPLSSTQIDAWVREARAPAAATPISSVFPAGAGAHRSAPLRRRFRSWAIAATVVLTVSAGILYQQWQDGRHGTDFGEQKILTLADGSVVTLNTSSELKVNYSGDRRAIRLLQGEALFRVAHDPTRPFEVSGNRMMVRAIGTQFNIRIAPRGMVVSVLDGVVEVADRRPNADQAMPPLRLHKGEESIIPEADQGHRHTQVRTLVNAHAATSRVAWTEWRVEFDNTPLVEVMTEFQRYRKFDVHIAGPLRQLKLTGSFNAQDPESALAYVATLPGVTVEQPSPHAYLVRKK